ncbi:hypothetical protein RCH09_003459 [Actimicrobium sp. GrIS 1.19]|uniref:hypothetical protein n=1 Tax=Actimicrobium sp. GrIS 1.19 TaxID=3071708 RepID=UPI002DFD0DEE|nr:hypothetical protein [Actimicrobium sp. GrIS 1.19]
MATSDAIPVIHRLNRTYENASEDIDHYIEGQMHGEPADPAAFFALVEQRQTTFQAMEARVKLDEKPVKTVLAEVR